MKKLSLLFLILSQLLLLPAQRSVKNVIIMIPDGTSTSILSLARWYQRYHNSENQSLAIDSILRGLVTTYSSDAPIGDSAPTTSCYMTGQPSQTGFIATYPESTNHDLCPIDPKKAYQPLATLFEATKYYYGMATGIVAKCEFPHATPADCASHTFNRNRYSEIAKQLIHNNIDVMMAGGSIYLNAEDEAYLHQQHYSVVKNYTSLQQVSSGKLWALLEPDIIPYCIDAADSVLSLSVLTQKAIELLSQNDSGFILMVEGSLVDWAAHENDAKTAILEFIEFDNAVKTALDFAKKDGHTALVVLPDHGNSGISMGNKNSKNYDRLSLASFFEPMENYQKSAWMFADELQSKSLEDADLLFKQYYRIRLTNEERATLYKAKDYKQSPIPKEKRSTLSLVRSITKILYDRTYIGFTTYGHTGEDVFFAGYHPANNMPTGVITNIDVNRYLCQQLQLENKLPELTETIFTPHTELFDASFHIQIDSLGEQHYRITAAKKRLKVVAESGNNFLYINNKMVPLRSVIVYMTKNKLFYLPKNIKTLILDR